MSDRPVLSADAVDLLLELLELPEPLLSGAAAELQPVPARQLMACGLLVPHDFEAFTTSMANHDDVPVPLEWSERAGGMSYFSPAAGPVVVPSDQLQRWRVNMIGTLYIITSKIDFRSGNLPFELSADVLWEVGEGRLGSRPQRTSVWFARRLWDRAVQRHVAEIARVRPHPRQRVILTSSRRHRLDDFGLEGCSIVTLSDVRTAPDSLVVSSDILDARFRGISGVDTRQPLYLSPDGQQLRINGGEPIKLSSDTHKAAIRKLVEAYRADRRVAVSELTYHGSLRRLFGTAKWALLKPYLKSSGNGLWGFDP